MKAAVLRGNCRFELEDVPFEAKGVPVIKVSYSGVCGTDLSYWKSGEVYNGQIIGHEYSGIVVDTGGLKSLQIGDKVAGYTQNVFDEYCGICDECRAGNFNLCSNRRVHTWKGGEIKHPGSYAEYTTWFPNSILRLDENCDLASASLIEPFTVGLHAVRKSKLQPGDKVLVLGGGIIGIAVSEWARLYGAKYISMTELHRDKIQSIESFNIVDNIYSSSLPDLVLQMIEDSQGGFDIVFDCVGLESAITTGIESMSYNFGNRLVGVALAHKPISFDYQKIVLREIELVGSKGHTFDEFRHTAQMISSDKLSVRKYISHVIPFEEIQEGFNSIATFENEKTIKAIIKMDT